MSTTEAPDAIPFKAFLKTQLGPARVSAVCILFVAWVAAAVPITIFKITISQVGGGGFFLATTIIAWLEQSFCTFASSYRAKYCFWLQYSE